MEKGSTIHNIGLRVKQRREELEMTQEELAHRVGYKSRSSINKIELGKNDIVQSTIKKLADALQTTPSFLMGWEESAAPSIPAGKNILPLPRFTRRPRLGTIACGKPILAVEDADEFDDVPEGVECDFTLLCKGDSMISARIFDGDVVYIRQQPEVENGQIAAVLIGDEATLKRVYYAPNGGRITLRACNPLYPDMEYEGEALNQIQILGLAVGFYSTIRHGQ